MKVLISMLFMVFFFSCCTTKGKMDENFLSGTILYSAEENDCAYTIKVSNEESGFVLYDPINLEDTYMKEGLNVKFQFKPLKMKNRCDKANPISITLMKAK
ncbi:hypothetical protein ACFQO1_10285 [Jejudonia soesokkakensis]|uniref:Lipoprotein n=1 Tax=Jejudonia soesokkakensis TaxID=1323432 RepID=A0ABW2MVA4_9FLAO